MEEAHSGSAQVMDQDTKSVEPCLQARRLFHHELITRSFFPSAKGLPEDGVGRHGRTFDGFIIGWTLRAIHDLDCLFMDGWWTAGSTPDTHSGVALT